MTRNEILKDLLAAEQAIRRVQATLTHAQYSDWYRDGCKGYVIGVAAVHGSDAIAKLIAFRGAMLAVMHEFRE